MHFPFLLPITNHFPDEAQSVIHQGPEVNTSEGGEFLDDALRMDDVDLPPRTEESVAAGSPGILL